MTEKYLVITGGSRGIGKSIVQEFIGNGWQVINLSRKPCKLENVVNIEADFQSTDWQEDVRREIENIFEENTRICLVHNAAISFKDTIEDLSIEQLEGALKVNLFTPLILNQLLMPFMAENSSIIYMGSTLAEKAVPGSASYIITKHAIAGAMKSTCQDLAQRPNIHTCCICPGFTETEMLKSIFDDPKKLESLFSCVSKNRLIQPQEIAALVYFCAQNPVINGSVIHANLGQIER